MLHLDFRLAWLLLKIMQKSCVKGILKKCNLCFLAWNIKALKDLFTSFPVRSLSLGCWFYLGHNPGVWKLFSGLKSIFMLKVCQNTVKFAIAHSRKKIRSSPTHQRMPWCSPACRGVAAQAQLCLLFICSTDDQVGFNGKVFAKRIHLRPRLTFSFLISELFFSRAK